jgi:hypothetical protein
VTVLQMAIAAGCLAGLGLTLIVWRLVPAQPHLMTALERLAPERAGGDLTPGAGAGGLQDRLGRWVQRHVPLPGWVSVPTRELALLRIPVHRYFGEKALYAVIGLAFPPLATVIVGVAGVRPPYPLALGASVALALVLSFIPDYNARTDAKTARQEFTRALGAYIDLVALERAGGAGSTQALESAAEVGDSWVFRRLREELARARWSGTPPWDALALLSDELGLPELSDLSDIMRLSGEEGATVYATLRARSASLRTALLSDEHAKANAAAEKMTMPVAALSLIFLVLLATPAMLRVVFGAH